MLTEYVPKLFFFSLGFVCIICIAVPLLLYAFECMPACVSGSVSRAACIKDPGAPPLMDRRGAGRTEKKIAWEETKRLRRLDR